MSKVAKFELTKEEEVIVKGLTPEELEEFTAADEKGQRNMLTLLTGLTSDADALSKEIEGGSIELADVSLTGDEDDDCHVLRPGGLGLRPGAVIVAQFMGTVRMISKDEKENWKEMIHAGTKYYYNEFYRFRRTDGTEFGIFQSPTLVVLSKVLTKSAGGRAAKDPVVRIHYVDKIEGKERLAKEFGITLKKGDACHVFNLKLENGAAVERYERGVQNYLRNPIPTTSVKEEITDVELAERNWAAVSTGRRPQIGDMTEQSAPA